MKLILRLLGFVGVLALGLAAQEMSLVLGIGAGNAETPAAAASEDVARLAVSTDSSIRTSAQSGTGGLKRSLNSDLDPRLRPVRSLHLLDLPAQRGSPSVGIDRKQFGFVPTQQPKLLGFQLLSLAPDSTGFNVTNSTFSVLESSERSSNDQLAPLLRRKRSFHLLDFQHQLNSDSLGK